MEDDDLDAQIESLPATQKPKAEIPAEGDRSSVVVALDASESSALRGNSYAFSASSSRSAPSRSTGMMGATSKPASSTSPMASSVRPSRSTNAASYPSPSAVAAVESDPEAFPPGPPSKVRAVARPGGVAYVWWEPVPPEKARGVRQWEIRRYRRDLGQSWQYKGSHYTSEVSPRYFEVRDLPPDCLFRFCVCGINAAGKGIESTPSPVVEMRGEPLPNGWLAMQDPDSGKSFYFCPRSGKSSWEHPRVAMQQVVASASQSSGSHSSSSSSGKELEGDAGGSSGLVSFFVDYSISRNFTDLEMMSLIDVYKEEMRNYGAVVKRRLIHIMMELGRPCPDARMLAAVIKEAARGDFQNAVSSSNSSGSGSDSGSGNSGKNSSDGGGNSGNGSSAGAKKSKASGGGSAAAGGLTPADMAESVRSFQAFMVVMQYLKIRALKIEQSPLFAAKEAVQVHLLGGRGAGDELGSIAMSKPSPQVVVVSSLVTRMGRWTCVKVPVLFDKVKYMCNDLARTKTWFMPQEVRLFVSAAGRAYVYSAFEPDEVEAMERIFLYLDGDITGRVSSKEFLRFLRQVDAILVSNNNHLDNDDEVRRFGDSSKSSSSPPSSPSSHAYAASQGQGKAAAVASRGLLMHGIHSLVYRTLEHSSEGLTFEQFLSFFVNLPERETEVRRHFRENRFRIAATGGLFFNGPTSSSSKTDDSSRKTEVDGSEEEEEVEEGEGGGEETGEGMPVSRGRRRLAKQQQGSGGETEDDSPPVRGNEFPFLDLTSAWPELARFRSRISELKTIYDKLLESNVTSTIWEVNSLKENSRQVQTADGVMSGNPWMTKLLDLVATAQRWVGMALDVLVDPMALLPAMDRRSRSKRLRRRRRQRDRELRQRNGQTDENNLDDASSSNDSSSTSGSDEDEARTNRDVRRARNNSHSKDESDDDKEPNENGVRGGALRGLVDDLMGKASVDTSSAHGPCCFCGCGNPFFAEVALQAGGEDSDEDEAAEEESDEDDAGDRYSGSRRGRGQGQASKGGTYARRSRRYLEDEGDGG